MPCAFCSKIGSMASSRTASRDDLDEHRPAFVMDEISKRIIELLQSDGRKPYVSIAAEVGCRKGPSGNASSASSMPE